MVVRRNDQQSWLEKHCRPDKGTIVRGVAARPKMPATV
jgi:hypothetical protein